MLICNHVIKDDVIVGIGPLMMTTPGDTLMQQLYNRRRLYFELHLTNHTTKIESDWHDIGTDAQPDERTAKERKLYQEFMDQYNVAKNKILELIGEPVKQ